MDPNDTSYKWDFCMWTLWLRSGRLSLCFPIRIHPSACFSAVRLLCGATLWQQQHIELLNEKARHRIVFVPCRSFKTPWKLKIVSRTEVCWFVSHLAQCVPVTGRLLVWFSCSPYVWVPLSNMLNAAQAACENMWVFTAPEERRARLSQPPDAHVCKF